MSISYAYLKYKSRRNVPLQYAKTPFALSEIYVIALHYDSFMPNSYVAGAVSPEA